MYIVLLSGGSGKRLWPLSNDLRSKQYIKIIDHETGKRKPCSMVQRVWEQLKESNMAENCIITASKGQEEIIKSQLGMDVKIALEPERRDTFPAIALSCAYLKSELGADDNAAVAILPVDPYTEHSYFELVKKIDKIRIESDAEIALMGAVPKGPSEKFGYIVPKQGANNYCTVDYFEEKPSVERAKELIAEGALWNCGVFCFKIGDILDMLKKYDIEPNYKSVYKYYSKLPKISFDYEVLEKCKHIVAAKFDGLWKDLGTWNTLTEQMSEASIGNVVVHESCKNTNVINELDIPVVAIGTNDLIVTASFDGILVSNKMQSVSIKNCIDSFTYPPMYEERRWGTIKVIDINRKEDIYTTTRKIHIFQQMTSSYHYHNDRDEVWTFLEGNAEIVINGIKQLLTVGDVIRIPKGARHAVKSLDGISFIEVQIGRTMADIDINRITLEWSEIECK